MEHSATDEADKCRSLAAHMRVDATRTTMPGFVEKLLRGAEDLERHASMLLALGPDGASRH
ncbi:MAG: hypothetical protein WDM91_21435 [Rhizomicrobium sp.]